MFCTAILFLIFWQAFLPIVAALAAPSSPSSSSSSPQRNLVPPILEPISKGWARRLQADPSFPLKSVTEVLLAAATQYSAEVSKRGVPRILPEIDFVVAGILTAVAGKYYSMWRVAPTLDTVDEDDTHKNKATEANSKRKASGNHPPPLLLFGTKLAVPTNAFQPTMADGITRPSLPQRFGSILAPMGPLFRAGIIASAIGYGVTAVMIFLRSVLVPTYVPVTQTMNILHACLYTGAFMAIVSNARYQILQGLIEPTMDKVFSKWPVLRGIGIFAVRWANGFLGSMLAISGMKALGLQRLKS